MLVYTPPPVGPPEPFVLTNHSSFCLGPFLVGTGRGIATSVPYTVANMAVFFPFTITTRRTYTGMLWINGTVVSGNVNGAIYNADGSAIAGAVIGSVAQAGTSVVQQKAFPAPVSLAPGTYFLAFAVDNTTATFVGQQLTGSQSRLAGHRQLTSFFALTASAAAWVGTTQTNCMIFGIYEAAWL